MATPNTDPVYSKVGVIGQSMLLTTQANDYNGVSIFNRQVFIADTTNGGFIQRLRFKARGTNVATVARIYIGKSLTNYNFATAPAAPTSTGGLLTGGTMLAGAYFATIIAVGPGGSQSVVGTYSASVSIASGSTGSIPWAWTAVTGAVSYRIYVTFVGGATGSATFYFGVGGTITTNSFTQVADCTSGTYDDPVTGNQYLYGELSLPATTAIATASTSDIDYPMNFALPAGYQVFVGLGSTVAAGWQVSSVGGSY